MKHFLIFLLIFFLYRHSTGSENIAVDVVHYRIELDIRDFSTRIIYGRTTVRLTPATAELDTIILELRQLHVDSVYIDLINTSNFTHLGDSLRIVLFQALQPGDTVAVTVVYHGVPYSESWGGFHFSGQYAFNLGVGFVSYPPNLGKAWFPCNDNFFDRALYDFHIRVAGNHIAKCGGLLQSITPHPDGSRTFHWKMSNTIPTYLASVAVGEYVTVTDTFQGMQADIPVKITVRPSDVWKVANSFANLHEIVSNFETRFGPYPFEKIGYTSTALGAMEHAGNIFLPHATIDNTLNFEWLYAHEVAHMWLGNKVTCAGPGEMWLNEGMAVWCEILYREDLYGHEPALVVQRQKHREVLQFAHTTQGDGAYYALHNIPPAHVYGTTVYQKGGIVAQTLRNYIGDSLFFPAIQAYLDSFAFSYASSHDLRNVLSQHTGINLNGFFDSWVFQPGFPNYSVDSAVLLPGNDVAVYVRQRSKGRDFTGNDNIVEITFMDASYNVYTDTMLFDGNLGMKVFHPPFEPSLLMLDYNEKICDATTDRHVFVHQPGTIEMTHTFTRLEVLSVTDTAFVRINHHWVAPDSLKSPITGLRLSPYRYWQVEGILPEGFHARGHFFYSRPAFLDNTLLLNQQNDSIVILYRPSDCSDWQPVDFTRIGPWSIGWIITDSLKAGEYTLAVWDTGITGNITRPPLNTNLRIIPNPTSGVVRIEWETENVTEVMVSAVNGSVVERIAIPKQQRFLEWCSSSLMPGIYIVTLIYQNTRLGSGRFIKISQ